MPNMRMGDQGASRVLARPALLMKGAFVTALLLLLVLVPASLASAHSRGAAQYKVTIKNLTSNQILSPPVFISHGSHYRLFSRRHFASNEVRLIAEGGDNGPATMRATASRRVYDVQTAGAVTPGQSTTVTVRSPYHARLSLGAMLVQTNDGFTGVDRLRLDGLRTRVIYLRAMDAGTEANNELNDYVPGFGGTMREPTHLRIRRHHGIRGVGDIDPAVYGWRGPVARLTITPVTP